VNSAIGALNVQSIRDDVTELLAKIDDVKLAQSTEGCAAGNHGQLRLGADNETVEICINDAWTAVGSSSNGGGGNPDPANYDPLQANHCQDLFANGFTNSGVYTISFGDVYCDMQRDGGGWTLLLTQTNGVNQYSGSTSPFVNALNQDSPSTSSAYSRDWSQVLLPQAGDQFMLHNSAVGDHVRFEMSTEWCGWNSNGNCYGSSSHLQFAHGQLYNAAGNQIDGAVYFNGCARDGGCYNSGSDGVGFGSNSGHTNKGNCYGGCWNGAVADFYWGGQSTTGGRMTYFWRPREASQAGCYGGCELASGQASCTDFKALDSNAASGKYRLTNGDLAYCDMVTDGGGWMLLLTQTHGRDTYEGSTSPLSVNLRTADPSVTSAFSRNWGTKFTPQSGDEFLLKSAHVGDWVRFETNTPWCGWNSNGNCYGSSSHLQFAHGQAFGSNGQLIPGVTYFNGCARDGGCYNSNSDGIGFGSNPGHTNRGDCWGGCWNGGYAGFYWGTHTEIGGALTYWHRDRKPNTYLGEAMASCKAFLNAGFTTSGLYVLTNGDTVYCDQQISGGGWQLLLTSTDATNQYPGSTSPFVHDLNADAPSLTSPYSRDWSTRFTPNSGDQFLLKGSNDWVRFVMSTSWCGWNTNGYCHGSSSHLQFAHGTTYSSSGANLDAPYFNGCARDGGCYNSGSDGVGFGSNPGHTNRGSNCYGNCWDGSKADFYWGDSNMRSAPYNMFYRAQ